MERIFTEGYIDLALSCFLNVFALLMIHELAELLQWVNSFGNVFNISTALLVTILITIMPLYIHLKLKRNFAVLYKERNLQSFGAFYEEYKLDDIWKTHYTVFMMIRRLLMITVLMTIEDLTAI